MRGATLARSVGRRSGRLGTKEVASARGLLGILVFFSLY